MNSLYFGTPWFTLVIGRTLINSLILYYMCVINKIIIIIYSLINSITETGTRKRNKGLNKYKKEKMMLNCRTATEYVSEAHTICSK